MSAKDNNSVSIHQATEYKSRRVFNIAAILLLLSFLLFLCQLINFGMFKAKASGLDSLPVSIRAASQADYSRDMYALSIPPINENILRQIIVDIPATGSPQDRMATLQVVLLSPVPTMTPDSRLPVTFTPTRTIEPLPSRTPSQLPSRTPSKTQMPTFSFTPTESFTPTKTFTPTRTSTPTKTATNTRSPAPIPTLTFSPTVTLTATVTPTSAPTATVEVPTDTPISTPTPTVEIPTDTDTPTPTATPSCALTSGGIFLSGSSLDMTITNNGSTLVTITSLNVNWPDTPVSQMLTEVKFNSVTIVNSSDPQPPSDFPSERNWTGTQSDRELAVSASKLLVLLFGDNLQSSGYSITVTFDNGCTLNESN
ncbi:MAG: hypothetical protein HZB50_05610 [Chloroflexi bacterium]|nr:hypothetical protein [Chloroflexota bacterium]